MIGYEEALALLLRDVVPLDTESVAAFDGAGRVLAADVRSPGFLPRFDNAAMDGFALALGDATGEAGRNGRCSDRRPPAMPRASQRGRRGRARGKS